MDNVGYLVHEWTITNGGGDIDLYIETSETDVTNIVNAKLAFSVTLTRQLGEQKIDVVVHRANSDLLPIHQIAKQTRILLCNDTIKFLPMQKTIEP